jgi:hypothetical protein
MIQREVATMNEKTREICEGINGSGQRVYLVFTTQDGRVVGLESFETREEAESWVRWA